MIPYKNLGGHSGIAAYSTGPDYIEVQFSKGTVYRYSYASAGVGNVEHMKGLANSGIGLNTFISKNVRDLFVK